jgi:hypothetical protein
VIRKVCADLLRHLPSEKAGQDEPQLGAQVVERGLDVLVGPGGISRLQCFEGEAAILVLEEGDVGVALRRLPDGAGQEDAGRVDAQRPHQALPERDQPLLVEG